jgi:O-succinylbenzoic acid--CoA ligase
VTHLSLVAAQLQRLLSTPSGQHALRRLKAVLVGGGATPAGLIERAAASEVPLYTTYGLTETASQVATSPPGASLAALKTSGRPLTPGTVRIASGQEIQVRGRTLFLGYLQRDGTLRRPLTPDGWFPTGDLGRLDEAGNLVVTGRKDNMFVSGGENIQPEEIEAALCAFQDVDRAIVVPVPDPEFGLRPAAFIAPAPGFTLEPDALRARLAKTLPRYKLPARFLNWPEDTPQTGLKPSRAMLQRLDVDRLREQPERPTTPPPEP